MISLFTSVLSPLPSSAPHHPPTPTPNTPPPNQPPTSQPTPHLPTNPTPQAMTALYLLMYFPQWGGFFSGPREGVNEADYYLAEYTQEEISQGMASASIKFAYESRSQRGAWGLAGAGGGVWGGEGRWGGVGCGWGNGKNRAGASILQLTSEYLTNHPSAAPIQPQCAQASRARSARLQSHRGGSLPARLDEPF